MLYAIDVPHSSISFSVKHMGITNVKGTFQSYTAKIEAESILQLENAQISIEIDVASISTKDLHRDQHLISADFFHADLYPKIKFHSTEIKRVNENSFYLTGDMTIKDLTRPVTFITEFTGHTHSPWGQELFGFTAKTTINRYDFNLRYNNLLETGGLLISENVDVFIDFVTYPL